MRQRAELEFSSVISVNDKMTFIEALKADQTLIVTDVASDMSNSIITVYFDSNDGDNGRIEIADDSIQVQVNYSFDRLIAIHNFIETYFDTILIGLLTHYTSTTDGSTDDGGTNSGTDDGGTTDGSTDDDTGGNTSPPTA